MSDMSDKAQIPTQFCLAVPTTLPLILQSPIPSAPEAQDSSPRKTTVILSGDVVILDEFTETQRPWVSCKAVTLINCIWVFVAAS